MIAATMCHSDNEISDMLPQQRSPSPQERLALLHQLLGEPACPQIGIYPIPDRFKLSVVFPIYNEERWTRRALQMACRAGVADPFRKAERLLTGSILISHTASASLGNFFLLRWCRVWHLPKLSYNVL